LPKQKGGYKRGMTVYINIISVEQTISFARRFSYSKMDGYSDDEISSRESQQSSDNEGEVPERSPTSEGNLFCLVCPRKK